MISIDPKSSSLKDIYKIMVGSIVPRPIGFVCTKGSAGVNLAPFSYFNGVCTNPPVVSVSVARHPDGSKKDTLRNIEETKEFTVNIVSRDFAEKMNQTSAPYAYGVDELKTVGLSEMKSEIISPPRVAESRVQMECRLHHLLEIGGPRAGATSLVLGEILRIHLSPEVYVDGKIQYDELAPVSRLGGRNYGEPPETFELPLAKVDLSAGTDGDKKEK